MNFDFNFLILKQLILSYQILNIQLQSLLEVLLITFLLILSVHIIFALSEPFLISKCLKAIHILKYLLQN